MKKRVLSIILSLVLFVSAIGTSVVSVNAAGVKTKQNNLMMPSSVTVGQNEKCYIYYDVIKGSCVNLKSTSNNSNVKVIQYSTGYASSRCNYGSSLIEGKNIGTANVTVKSDNGSITGSGVTNASGSCKVTVKKAPSSVKLSTTNLTLGKGEIFTISESTNSGSYANTDNLRWSSSNTKVATVLKGSDNKATISAKGTGTANVTIKTYNGKTATCKVTVKNAPSSVKLSKTSLTLNKGKSYTISESTNSGSYSNAAHLKWSSSNTKVATVTKGSGNKATIKAVGKGTAYIGIKTYNGKTAKCKVTVK